MTVANEMQVESLVFPSLDETDQRMAFGVDEITNNWNLYSTSDMRPAIAEQLLETANEIGHKNMSAGLHPALVIWMDSDIATYALMLKTTASSYILSKTIFLMMTPPDQSEVLSQTQISTALDSLTKVLFNSLVFVYSNSTLYEVYRISPSSKLTVSTINMELEETIWVRRKDLNGIEFFAAYALNKPYVYIKEGMLAGTNVQIIQSLAQELNFSVTIYPVADGAFGSYDPATKLWNGVVGDLISQRADIVIADLAVTSTRSEVIDFTRAIFQYENKLYMKKPLQSINWLTFVEVFSLQYWLAVIVIGIVLTLSLMSVKKWIENPERSGGNPDMPSSSVSVGLALMSLDVKQGNPHRLTTRILVMAICLFGALNFWSYNAGLVSLLTVEVFNVPINQLKDLLEKPQYQIMVVKSTSHEGYFKETSKTSSDHVAYDIWTNMIKDNKEAYTQNTVTAELDLLADDKKVYFSQEMAVESTMGTYPCQIISSSTRYFKM